MFAQGLSISALSPRCALRLTRCSIWLLDVRELAAPSARLEGLDISFDAAPPAETLPPNVKFRHWDVKEDVPEDLVGVFDIVHVRFLSCVLLNDQVPAAVGRLFKMLSLSPLPVAHLISSL